MRIREGYDVVVGFKREKRIETRQNHLFVVDDHDNVATMLSHSQHPEGVVRPYQRV